ncbi:hypothetical protein [Salipaludibacillus aurantiacus]|uniref:Uncharacterized protein n=1 Tax=Salipaludibacillus aurantiacus TaxID=1601833 RepID=A0A1H9R6P0_9BACI|nr:hypothetical protein [Salipaludibacillus aurantiacus]SER68368.1 hypothetical protein SAMN05518684_10311 [Salipaludibacillus aurantiacus]
MKENKIVLLLPFSVMVGLFIFGYLSLGGTETISNENLKNAVSVHMEKVAEDTVKVDWQWNDFPEDGLHGNDYIELVYEDGNNEVIHSETTLFQGDAPVYEGEEWFFSAEGAVAVFPNEMQDNRMLGPAGTVTFQLSEPVTDAVVVRYYHTWTEHQLTGEETSRLKDRFEEEQIQSYWVVETEG